MAEDIFKVITEVDNFIRKHPWFDFHVFKYCESNLIIAGGTDLSYYHSLEIIFEDVFYVSGHFEEWRSNTDAVVFRLPENHIELNAKLQINEGYQVYMLVTEDFRDDFIIACKGVSYNTDKVYYYKKGDLVKNERISEFVKS